MDCGFQSKIAPILSSAELFGVGLQRYLAGILQRYLALIHV
jgi:hypothetical protein